MSPMNVATYLGGGALVQVLRGGDLPRSCPLFIHTDAVGHGQRLFLIVGHEDGGGAGGELDAANLVAQLDAHLGVEGGERLVEQ